MVLVNVKSIIRMYYFQNTLLQQGSQLVRNSCKLHQQRLQRVRSQITHLQWVNSETTGEITGGTTVVIGNTTEPIVDG